MIPQAFSVAALWRSNNLPHSRVAARFIQAADMRRILSHLFDGTSAYVKDWPRFLRALADLYQGGNAWSLLPDSPDWEASNVDVGYSSETLVGEQIGGYRGGDPPWGRGLEPPEYAEYEMELPSRVSFTITVKQDIPGFAHNLASDLRPHLTDPKGFARAVLDIFGNARAAKLMAKLAADHLQGSFRAGESDAWFGDEDSMNEWLEERLDGETLGGSPYGSWTDTMPKVTGSGVQGRNMVVTLHCTVEVSVEGAEPQGNEPDYESMYEDRYGDSY